MAANDTRRLRVVVTGDSEDAQQALEQVGESADETQGKFATLARGIAAFAGSGVLALGAVGAAAVTMGFSTASQLEQVEVGFTTMLGSAEKAQKFMKQLQDFAAATPFEFTELTSAAQQFLAMGFAAKDVIPMLRSVGDAVAAMGGTSENIDSVTRALGQMQAKGKVSGEELMQLTEQGIPALKILADSYGVSTAKMSEMVTKGQVMSDKAIPALIKGLSEGTKNVQGFGGMMEKQSATMQGKWSTFMDTLQMGLGNLAKRLLPATKVAIDILTKGFSNFFAGIEGKGKLKGFSGTLNEIGLGLRGMVEAFKEGDVTSDGLVGKFETFGVVARKVVDALTATTTTMMQVVAWFREHETVTKTLTIAMGSLLAVTKAHAIVTGIQAAGGLLAMIKNMQIVASITKVVTAVQWAYNGAIAAAAYLQVAGYLGALSVAQKAVAFWTKIVTAAQWLWNAAMTANPIGIIIVAIAAVIAAIVLLWKNNEGFRNFVLNVLWPAIKKAWEAIKNAVMVVIDVLVKGFVWYKNMVVTVWSAIINFLRPIISSIVSFMTPIITTVMKIGSVVMGFYEAVWKIVWILIQIAVKIFVAYFMNVVVPAIKVAINVIVAIVKFLWNVWQFNWNLIKGIVSAFIGWIMGTVVPALQRAWNIVKIAVGILKQMFINNFTIIKNTISAVWKAIAGPISAVLNVAFTKIKGWVNTFKIAWNLVFDTVKAKVDTVMDKVAIAFNKGKDAIKAAWDKIRDVVKAPINFVINSVYNDRIRPMWNKIAEKFGIKTRLDEIKGFARGGTVGRGYGSKDDQLALLTRGEGILTTKEMKRLGGPRGFQEFRQSLAMYNKGGIVGGDGEGWFNSLKSKAKDIFQGMAGTVIKPLVKMARQFINAGLPGDGFTGLMRAGSHTMLDKLVGWVSGKDKEIGAIGGAGGAIGYRAMQALIRGRFPTLGMISGFRPGARTLSGNRSYHSMGRAVDYPPVLALAQWIRGTFGARTKELITPWNNLNLHNGQPHRYTGAVWNQHNFAGGNAHVHWAMDDISTVQPGWFTGYNGTGKPETLVNADKIPTGPINVTININGAQDPRLIAKTVRDEIINLSRRNGGRAGLPKS